MCRMFSSSSWMKFIETISVGSSRISPEGSENRRHVPASSFPRDAVLQRQVVEAFHGVIELNRTTVLQHHLYSNIQSLGWPERPVRTLRKCRP